MSRLPETRAPECTHECQQAVDYGVWDQYCCTPRCAYLHRMEKAGAISDQQRCHILRKRVQIETAERENIAVATLGIRERYAKMKQELHAECAAEGHVWRLQHVGTLSNAHWYRCSKCGQNTVVQKTSGGNAA